MKFLQDNKAETPIEVLFIVMGTILILTLVTLTFGAFLDGFINTWSNILLSMPMSSWGNGMYANIVTNNVKLAFLVPGFFVIIIMLWGIKTVIKKHQYSTQDQQYMADENY